MTQPTYRPTLFTHVIFEWSHFYVDLKISLFQILFILEKTKTFQEISKDKVTYPVDKCGNMWVDTYIHHTFALPFTFYYTLTLLA